MDNNTKYIVEDKFDGQRLDKFLNEVNPDFSRSYLQKLIEKGMVSVDGKAVRRSHRVKKGNNIILTIPEPEELDLKPLDMELEIIYEDKYLIVVNKPAGLIVHPAPGNRNRTLVNALLAHTDNLSGIGGVKRPGIVHRLDKDTSGILVVAKKDKSHRELVKQFKTRKTEKIYRTIVRGNFNYEKGQIDAPIGRNPRERKKMAVVKKNSKKAVTHFQVMEQFDGYSYLEVELETGRTHQIRVHFSYLGHPVLGDKKYGRKNKLSGVKRQLLHAYRLGLFHPETREWMEFVAPIPQDFKETLSYLKKRSE